MSHRISRCHWRRSAVSDRPFLHYNDLVLVSDVDDRSRTRRADKYHPADKLDNQLLHNPINFFNPFRGLIYEAKICGLQIRWFGSIPVFFKNADLFDKCQKMNRQNSPIVLLFIYLCLNQCKQMIVVSCINFHKRS